MSVTCQCPFIPANNDTGTREGYCSCLVSVYVRYIRPFIPV